MHLFGRHVLGRAQDSARRRTAARSNAGQTLADDFRETKVANLNYVVAGNGSIFLHSSHDEYVCRLQITMQNAFVVRGFDPGTNLAQQVERARY